ncbi:MAG: BrxA/BrxB family bacilliredoxin [Planctomycetota bacterium]|nr:BrxA/BrxB family bacilliredoxin [Planctomycetota bacterium]
MPYDPMLVEPMREDMRAMSVQELTDPAGVDAFLAAEGTKLVFVNSVCGCAAGQARPALRLALQHANTPDHAGTVFAGQDVEATAHARGKFAQVPPSSPSIALFKGDELVWFMPRHLIESRDAQTIAFDLVTAFDEHCS